METPSGLIIRPELSNDIRKITGLYDEAFGQPCEGKLVDALRHNPLFIQGLSLVAVVEEKLAGHILFFPVFIRGGGKVFQTLALGPMAVLPGYHRKGIGTALVNAGIDEAKAGKFRSVLVLGHPDYYPRFGFKSASQYGIYPPFEVSQGGFLAMELLPDSLRGVSGCVEYPAEYAEV